MIRVVTLDSYDDKQLAKFSRTLYTAFGVGSEHPASASCPRAWAIRWMRRRCWSR